MQLLLRHLEDVDTSFEVPLSSRLNIEEYTEKLYAKATLVESWDEDVLIGLLAYYVDTDVKRAFITNVSVLVRYRGKDVATDLMRLALDKMKSEGIKHVVLEVHPAARHAQFFYRKFQFEIEKEDSNTIRMILRLIKCPTYDT